MKPIKLVIEETLDDPMEILVLVWQGTYLRENKPEDYRLVESFKQPKAQGINVHKWL